MPGIDLTGSPLARASASFRRTFCCSDKVDPIMLNNAGPGYIAEIGNAFEELETPVSDTYIHILAR